MTSGQDSGGNNCNCFPGDQLTKLTNLVQLECVLMLCRGMEGGLGSFYATAHKRRLDLC